MEVENVTVSVEETTTTVVKKVQVSSELTENGKPVII